MLTHNYCLQKAREQWAETLWANLNVNVLSDGIDTYMKSLRRLPRDVKSMPVARMLDEIMKEFRDSLPLFMDLKHEALRTRHWNELMKKTGQSFEMNPDTFTLANIFAMELHRYSEVIGEIVTAATKELSIEKVSKDLMRYLRLIVCEAVVDWTVSEEWNL